MSAAFVFPGQGAQQVGMMADLAEASPAARRVFEQADAQLGYALSDICFAGPEAKLDATDIAQPAMFVCSAAVLAAMEEAIGAEKLPQPAMMAGLSLGEYTALYAADAIDFDAALDLVARRGRAMQEAAEAAPSGMVSIIGLEEPQVRRLCEAAAEGATLVPANFNCPGQIVISGDLDACGRAAEMAKDFDAKGAVPLKVAGAFHSPLMAPAAEKLSEALAAAEFRTPRRPVVGNVAAAAHESPQGIREKLIAQLTRPVRWAESMQFMLDNGVETFYEIGPGRVLAGLMRRISRRTEVVSLNSANAVAKLAGRLACGAGDAAD